MRFGKTLRESVYAPWKDKYIDYAKLKSLLREDKYEDEDVPWTEEDESRFCDEIFNTQLEKVAEFQEKTVEGLRSASMKPLEKLKDNEAATQGLEAELDSITNEIGELKKYSNINYTAFLKIVKKHDRKRGRPLQGPPHDAAEPVAPALQLGAGLLPAPQQAVHPVLRSGPALEDEAADIQLPSELEEQGETHNGERYTAHKFWVHPDNLLEVKTYILRRLPALVYSEQSSKGLDVANDPTITSLYFDNSKFELYSNKVDRQAEASSFRVRWYGQLSSKPDLTLEQKTVGDHGSSEERRMVIKEKYVKPFLDGEYKMDKTIQKMKRQSQAASDVEAFRKTVDELDKFVQEKGLQPVLRANYVRSAFQKPSDDRVRISLDTELAFIREDTLDRDRPCRDPSQWHRLDIDDRNLTFPFKDINQSEVSRFPYAVLEIKLRDLGKKRPAWIEDLMGSHLVHPAPRFSKFVHGVASLFEDYVNNLPFWLSDLEGDIRKDPQKAFEAEEKRRSQRAEDEVAVGSFLGKRVSSYKASRSSPAGQSYLADRMAAEASLARSVPREPTVEEAGEPSEGREHGEEPEQGQEQDGDQRTGYGTLSAVLPSFSLSRYSRARHERERPLPEGVVEPSEWVKNTGELKIEPKVWLANERTFLKWQHICILLGGLAVSLYSAAGRNTLAEVMGIMYILIAVFAGGWGYWMMGVRRRMIIERSGKDFDNVIGPLVISVALMIALILNFVFAYRRAVERWDSDNGRNATESFSEELR
ncbi:vacuolar transporter chaperone 2 [Verticillium alfalfae VaMs.102]|uniref:Vacuolar transporter chaperone 2 n=1 Tax=Verticillium alfalfae (strain VaMs.102 / ATCC MYA-4576 / FGSC 10136) TaxID=526221 RepID=C9SQA5_VERA1|nr:vacuolar transporter chaperone 2 [Verticillium alfalfae VaMs.102]EEY21030.1 vacuolar transporter chaperone 2 [Verticillium alfalfae VaMs.102]